MILNSYHQLSLIRSVACVIGRNMWQAATPVAYNLLHINQLPQTIPASCSQLAPPAALTCLDRGGGPGLHAPQTPECSFRNQLSNKTDIGSKTKTAFAFSLPHRIPYETQLNTCNYFTVGLLQTLLFYTVHIYTL